MITSTEAPAWLFPQLRRPQYPPSPDLLQVALAWSLVEPTSGLPGLMFNHDEPPGRKRARRFEIAFTAPGVPDAHLPGGIASSATQRQAAWHQAARKALRTELEEAGPALEKAVQGLSGQRSRSTVASPLTPSLARMQDLRGAMAVENPPDFAAIIETLYQLGDPTNTTTAAATWAAAMDARLRRFPILRGLDDSASQLLNGLWSPRIERRGSSGPATPRWWHLDSRTPFHWFRLSWNALCMNWATALPPRRWTEWASAVLRTALGFGYLWECAFFLSLARHALTAGEVDQDSRWSATHRHLFAAAPPLIIWEAGGGNIGGSLDALVTRGLACRALLLNLAQGLGPPDGESMRDAFDHVARRVQAADATLKDDLQRAAAGSVSAGGLKNLRETVRYALIARDAGDGLVDHYGFLRSEGRRGVHVQPSGEWVVLMAALAAGGPGRHCRLDDVQRHIAMLGVRPRVDVLCKELERAGLAEGSADGDGGVRVHPAFQMEE
jgi:hypothetical protein